MVSACNSIMAVFPLEISALVVHDAVVYEDSPWAGHRADSSPCEKEAISVQVLCNGIPTIQPVGRAASVAFGGAC